MSVSSRLVVLLLLAATCLALPAGDVIGGRTSAQRKALAYPDAPRQGYTPEHVRQRFNNCAFASAQMLIDKWTEGRVDAPQGALRRASGIAPREGGPTLRQLRKAVARVAGIDLRWSPNGGDRMTWDQLLDRLADGGGALVNIWPARLPRYYRRWIPTLTSGHSVYIERYQPRRDRIWLMDPLGRGRNFQGEWISADVLYRAIWRSGRYIWGAATPEREQPRAKTTRARPTSTASSVQANPEPLPPPSLDGFAFAQPELSPILQAGGEVELGVPYTQHAPDATLPDVRVQVTWRRLPDELPFEDGAPGATDPAGTEWRELLRQLASPDDPPIIQSLDLAADDPGAEVPVVEVMNELRAARRYVLRGSLDTPSKPGYYALSLELRDVDGRPFSGDPPIFDEVVVQLVIPEPSSLPNSPAIADFF
jgi:hypothetical protein